MKTESGNSTSSSLSDLGIIEDEISTGMLNGTNKDLSKKGITDYIFTVAAFSTLALSNLGVAQNFPVFPSIGKSKGLHNTEIGLIFSTQSFMCAFLFPFCSILLTILNKKVVLCVNSFMSYCVFIMTGLLPVMSSVPFQVYAFLFQGIQALNETMMFLSVNLIMWEMFPKKQSTMVALQELSISIGYVSGPSVCAILYPWIGYFNMYLLVGVTGLVITLIIVLILSCTDVTRNAHNQIDSQDKQFDVLVIMKIILTPSLCLHIAVLFFTGFFYSYFTPIIGPYLISRYHVTVSTVGWVIMSGELVYLVFSLIMGYLFDNHISSFYMSVAAFGLLAQSVGVLLYPPSSLIFPYSGNNLPVSFVGSTLNGMGIAFCFIPVLSSLLAKAEEKFPSTSNVESSVAGLFTGAYYLGEGMGQWLVGY